MEKLIRVLEGITATLWAITILYSIFFFSLGGFLLNDIFQEILIGLITGAISSLVFTSISYFAFLHKIPEKTHEKIEKLLNDRLGYETTNHNAVMGALNPNNEVLLNLVSKDHRELKVLTGETLQHLRMEKAAKENREHIRYDAKLNSDESLVYGDNGNKNEVVLTWKRTNDTYYDTLIDDAHIYTYATNITKTFSDGKEEQTMFDNVLFKAQNASDGYYVIAQLNEDEGIWYVTGHTDKEASATAMHPVEWNGKKGQIILKGVEDDQYIWTELETANGYTLLKNNIDVTIKSVDDANRPCDIYGKDTLGVIQNDQRYNFPNNEDYKLANIPQKQLAHNYQTASATVDGNDVTMLDDEMDAGSKNAIAPLQVVNTRGFETPMTGENGTWALAIGGVLVFCLGTSAFIFFLVFKKRKEQEDK